LNISSLEILRVATTTNDKDEQAGFDMRSGSFLFCWHVLC